MLHVEELNNNSAPQVLVLLKVNVKCSRYRPSVAQRVIRSIALLFHDRGTRKGWVASSKPRPHFTPGKDPAPILQDAWWATGLVWTGGKSRPHRDSIPDRPARSQSLYRLGYTTHIFVLLGHEIKEDEVVGSCSMDAINKEHKKFTICCREWSFKESNGPILTEIRSKCVVKFTAFIQEPPTLCIVIASPSSIELMHRKTGERETSLVDVMTRMHIFVGTCSPSPSIAVCV